MSNKEELQDAAMVTLGNKRLKFTFKQDIFSYKGHPSTQFDTKCQLKVGQRYFITDVNCESHLSRELMTLIGPCRQGEYGADRLLFKDNDDNFWQVRPRVALDLRSTDIRFELEGECTGKNLKKKIVVKEEKSYTIKLLD